MVHPLIRSVATALLAGFSGAVFAAVAADLLHLSPVIAGVAAGFVLAVVVSVITYRYRPRPPGATDT